MKISQYKIGPDQKMELTTDTSINLVLVFADRGQLENGIQISLAQTFPNAKILYCSTAGEIMSENVSEGTVCITAIQFEKTAIRTSLINIANFKDSIEAGNAIVSGLLGLHLKHILVFADGQMVNGSDLVTGMNEILPPGVTISGGLAGDGARFEKTLVGLDDNIQIGNIAAIGLYGEKLDVGYSSRGGWDSFGPDRKITKSSANVLYELDGKSALSLYKKYLGDLAAQLPGSALLFPIAIRVGEAGQPLVRTILSINEEDQSMTFAGNMPEGAYARLMKANFDRLIDAAAGAAETCLDTFDKTPPQLALLVSCVGRRIVLGQRIEEEIESVRDGFGKDTALAGFYSYGEISPLGPAAGCELYNQTMTITAFREL
jgi:hypothetical protein